MTRTNLTSVPQVQQEVQYGIASATLFEAMAIAESNSCDSDQGTTWAPAQNRRPLVHQQHTAPKEDIPVFLLESAVVRKCSTVRSWHDQSPLVAHSKAAWPRLQLNQGKGLSKYSQLPKGPARSLLRSSDRQRAGAPGDQLRLMAYALSAGQ